MPLVVAKRPCCQCTVIAATIIGASISAGPIGPRKPSAVRIPPRSSLAPAAKAKKRPGRKPGPGEVPAFPWGPVPAEPAEELLRAVPSHDDADDQPEDE